MLGKMGHQVDTAVDGIDALDQVRGYPGRYDLILMDINMPRMDGIMAKDRIKALGGPSSEIPIIALTANAMDGDQEKYLQAGLDDYLAKPIDRTELIRVLEDVSRHKKMKMRSQIQHDQSALHDADGGTVPKDAHAYAQSELAALVASLK